jgi:hypothetical protein
VTIPNSITVTSPAFTADTIVPARFACKALGGVGETPPVSWQSPSSGVGAFAVVLDEPLTAVHWVLFNIPATTDQILEGTIPNGVNQAQNAQDQAGYNAPCPAHGRATDYRFTVYALSQRVPWPNGAPLRQVLAAIAARTVYTGQLSVKFGTSLVRESMQER